MTTLVRSMFVVGAVALFLAGCSGASGTSLNLIAGTPNMRHHARSAYRVLYSFKGGSDGAVPQASLLNFKGRLYGTTSDGGAYGSGTVFAVTTSGHETVLHSFGGSSDGAVPVAELVNFNGALYGTTVVGGGGHGCEFHAGCGTIYRISTAGEEKVLYRFAGGSDGDAPVAGLVNVNGTLYGTTENGGGSNKGTFFSIAPASKDHSLLYVFTGHYPNGANPKATLLDFGGTLYGTTHAGLGKNRGTVFSITTAGTEQSLHVFKGEPDGAFPFAALVNVSGSLYGTTYEGGIGYGTVFRITPPYRKLTVIYKFGGGADGGSPIGGLININGTLYGTTEVGGHSGCVRFNDGCGTIYSMSTTGVKNVLYRFKGPPDGGLPVASLTNVNGTLYGTTHDGGTKGEGTIFAFTP